jgi:hypothetical protein
MHDHTTPLHEPDSAHQFTKQNDEPLGWESPSDGFWTARFRQHEPAHSSNRVLGLVLAGVLLAALAVAVVVPAVWKERAEVLAPASIELIEDGEGRPEAIAAKGFDEQAVAALGHRHLEAGEWSELFHVEASGGPVPGTWELVVDAVFFYPNRPFEKGVTYTAGWSNTPAVELTPERPGAPSPTYVTAVHPATDLIPRNLSRIVIEFSNPMGEAEPLDHISLLTADGRALPLGEKGLEPSWNEDRTQLVLPLVARSEDDEEKPQLEAGSRYRLLVHRSWKDAEGRLLDRATLQLAVPLQVDCERRLAVGPHVVGDVWVALEIELRCHGDVRRLHDLEMDMRGPCQPRKFLQPRYSRRDRVPARHDGLDLVSPVLVGPQHPPHVETGDLGEVAGRERVIDAFMIRLPHFDQGPRKRGTAIGCEHRAGQDQPVARFVGICELAAKGRAKPIERTDDVMLGRTTGLACGKCRPGQERAADEHGILMEKLAPRNTGRYFELPVIRHVRLLLN